ncbi:MAG: DUF420 domain-containing protein [Chitinophagales bacterium]|nr:DUF420 domain-containing protein [Chitinophagales bacterium]
MKDRTLVIGIGIITLVVMGLVFALYFMPKISYSDDFDIYIFPKIHAIINSLVSILLLAGLYFIKTKQISKHKFMMLSAVVLSAGFLISYVLYHSASEPTSFGGDQPLKGIYYFVLITHVILAAVSFPFILWTVAMALTNRFTKHKKIARYVWPVWFYVSVTGVIVYLMISPYYGT